MTAGRYTEIISYVGFSVMCIAMHLDNVFIAALCHDLTALIFGLGIFVEGLRMIQFPLFVAFFAT